MIVAMKRGQGHHALYAKNANAESLEFSRTLSLL